MAMLVLGLYWQTTEFAPLWDDRLILSGTGIGGGTLAGALDSLFLGSYYRPFTSLSYAIDRQIWINNAFGYHQTNILLHLLATIAVAWMATVVSQRRDVGAAAGALFATQAAQVAAVAWIGGRTDTLSALATALFVGATVQWVRTRRLPWLAGAAGALLTGALVKEQNLALILAVPMAEAVFAERGHRRPLPGLAAMALTVVAFLAIWIPRNAAGDTFAGAQWDLVPYRLGVTTVHYAALLFTPSGSSMAVLTLANYTPEHALLGYGILIAWLLGAAFAWRRNAAAGFLMALAAVLFLPISNLIPLPSLLVGPYRAASLGVPVAVLIGWGLIAAATQKKPIGLAALVMVAIANAGGTFAGIPRWRDDTTWFGAVVRNDPRSALAQNNNFVAIRGQGRHDEALKGIEDYLDWVFDGDVWTEFADNGMPIPMVERARWKLGTTVGTRGEATRTVANFVALRGNTLASLGQTNAAEANYRSALGIDPKCDLALTALGDMMFERDRKEARDLYTRAVDVVPSFSNLARMGRLELAEGNYREAEGYFQQAVELTDWISDLWIGLAEAQARQGKADAARESLERAERSVRVDPAAVRRVREILEGEPE